jgi:uncharacterized protein (DUF4415 family)
MYKYVMKKRKPVRPKRVKQRRIAQLRASSYGKKPPREITEQWLKYYKPRKQPVTLRLDADVLAFFKEEGRGYQTRINDALRKLIEEKKKS